MRGEVPFPPDLTQTQRQGPPPQPRDDSPEFPPAPEIARDLVRIILAILFVAGLIAVSFWILWPFLPATIWATTLVVTTWPLMLRVQRQLWHRRWLAVVVMTVALLLVFVAPFWLAITTITQNFDRIASWASALSSFKLPEPPLWLDDVPLFGSQIIVL